MMDRKICLLLIFSLCGLSVASPLQNDWRIAGGELVHDSTTYPMQCSVWYQNDPTCGCVIIGEKYALTAVSCARVLFSSFLAVHVGSTHVNTGGQNYEVRRVIEHPDYVAGNASSPDLAILELSFPLVLTQSVMPVSLPLQDEVTPPGSPAIALGWGFSAEVGPISPTLKEVTLVIRDLQECADIYAPGEVVITDTKICAEPPVGETGATCQRDEGGPVLVDGKLHGIISDRALDACTGQPQLYPSVYTRVAAFRDWIDANTPGL